jgi:hypothetical protein
LRLNILKALTQNSRRYRMADFNLLIALEFLGF